MIDWIQNNWVAISAVVLAILRLAESIAAITPSERDDIIVAKVAKVIKNFFTFGWGKKN